MHHDRYTVPSDEDYELNSNEEVLKNLLGIKEKQIINAFEEKELIRTGSTLPALYGKDYQFKAEDISDIHALWLSNIYPFAGKYRTVTMSKEGFPFAAPQYIPNSMNEFEVKFLKKYTPCTFMHNEEIAFALGIVHTELIIIHPFREGNGRVARLLANLMALQAGRSILNYELIDRTINKKGYDSYIRAIHRSVDRDYTEIQNIFLHLIKAT
jgi:cell filamentation protein